MFPFRANRFGRIVYFPCHRLCDFYSVNDDDVLSQLAPPKEAICVYSVTSGNRRYIHVPTNRIFENCPAVAAFGTTGA
jgi:hypothetical protein